MIEHEKTKQARLRRLKNMQLTTLDKLNAMLIGFALVMIIENILTW